MIKFCFNHCPEIKNAIQELKSAAGWINGYILHIGYALDDKGYATLSTSLISVVQRHISQTTTYTATHMMVILPPAPSQAPHIPPIINTNPSQAVDEFGKQGSCNSCQPTNDSVGHILAVSINGHSYNGSIFDSNGTRRA